MSETKIKPCPFCGGRAKLFEAEDEVNYGGRFIQCAKCLASSAIMFPLKEGVDELLRERWNTRVKNR